MQRIRDEIRSRGPISFARFQELALYDPDSGYYTCGAGIGGEDGDFWTAPEMSPVFGELVGAQVAEMARRIGGSTAFRVLEFGAGSGSLASALLDAWRREDHSLYRPGVYRIVEASPALRRCQRERLSGHGEIVSWEPGSTTGTGRGDRPPGAPARPSGNETVSQRPAATRVTGVLLMNEVLDALPVHRVVMGDRGLCEIRIGLQGDGLREMTVPAGEVLREELQKALPPGRESLDLGQEAEVRLAYRPFLEEACRHIGTGYLLVIDYGLPAGELYGPLRRRGTAMAYHRHRATEDLLAHPGAQDITAHVDLSALERIAGEMGFRALGVTTQMRFLLALGLGRRLQELEDAVLDERARVQRHLGMTALIRPGGMGEMFKVWIGGRRVSGHLSGLDDVLAASDSSRRRSQRGLTDYPGAG